MEKSITMDVFEKYVKTKAEMGALMFEIEKLLYKYEGQGSGECSLIKHELQNLLELYGRPIDERCAGA